jgi:ribosomal protein L40E
MIVGTALAILALCFVLYPLFQEPLGMGSGPTLSRSSTGVTTAVDALREIEFDHVTGKLSDTDYAELKSSYTQSAIAAMRGSEAETSNDVICARCGPRPEQDAVYCSECGHALAA